MSCTLNLKVAQWIKQNLYVHRFSLRLLKTRAVEKLLWPPTRMNDRNEKGKESALVCGRRFRRMLRCVEQNSSSAACTDRINEFLSCERAVFLAALAARSKNSDENINENAAPRKVAPRPRHLPPSIRHEIQPFDGLHRNDSQSARSSADSGWVFDEVRSTCWKAVSKQGDACSKLVQTALKPESRSNLFVFADRMVADIGKTLSIMRRWISDRSEDVGGKGGDKDSDNG